MNRFYILSLLIFLINSAFSQQENSVSMELMTLKNELEPGKIHTVVYKIINKSRESKRLSPGISLPTDWKVISEIKGFSLNPGEQQILILSFNVPAKYNAGSYYFTVKLVDLSNLEKVCAEIRSEFKVKEETALSLELVVVPDFIKAGEPIKASYIVRNNGNTLQSVLLTSFNCQIDGQQKISLVPGGSVEVNITSETNANLTDQSRNYFYLEAKGGGASTGQVYGFVNVIPVNSEANDLYHRIPVKITSRYIAKGREGEYNGGFQFEASGSGTLDPAGKHKVEFLARGPNRFDMSLLGLYDEYYFSYSNDLFNLKAGDASYSLTPLTEYARYGTGFEHKMKITSFSQAGLLFVTPRFYKNIKAEYGAYAKIDFYKQNNIGFYFLQKLMPGQEQNVNLYSITANLQPFERTAIELEASRGNTGKTADNAYRVNLSSQISNVSLSAFYFHTGKNYPGYYTNSDFYSGIVNYNPTDWFSMGISGRQDFMNAELDTLFMTAPLSRQYQGILNFKIAKRILFRTYARQYERQDRSPLEKFHYKTRSINVALNDRQNRFGYNLEGEYGKTQNFLLAKGDDLKNTFSGTGNLYFQPSPSFYVQGFVSYANINSFLSGQQNNWIYGLNLSASLLKNIKASLQLQNTYSIEDIYQNRDLFQLNIDYHFLKRHTISLNSFYTLFQNELNKPDFSFSINYSIDFGIPMKKTANAGSVSGKIENLGVKKVSGVILYIGGRSTVTNENGEFSFKNINPGKYNLLIDRTTVEMMDICDIQSPLELIVEDNKVTILNFGLIKAAKLSGKIEIDKPENELDEKVDESMIIGHVMMELTRDNESIRILSDEKGQFSFPLVRPGKWYLKVYGNGIDKQHNLEKDYFDFELQPGEQRSIVVKVLKKKRNIIFQNNSINLSTGKK